MWRGIGRPTGVVVAATALLLTGCSPAGDQPSRRATAGNTASTTVESPTASPTVSSTPTGSGLVHAHPCKDGFTCAELVVPVDRAEHGRGTLSLAVAVETEQSADRGVLLLLAGGPGQAAVPLVPRLVDYLGKQVVAGYRVVALDQRGTGATALQCPELQQVMGFSDLTPPPAAAVRACARTIGKDREFYSTDDVVADLDQFRKTLGVATMTIYGTSYGTFVAEQYALAHPTHTEALVLDSVVPHDGIDPLAVDVMHSVRRVLADACGASGCPGDPVADLATVVRREHNGTDLLDLATAVSIVEPGFESFLHAVHRAADGDVGELDDLLAGYRQGFHGPADELSQGLHASALCSDMHFPWGSSAAPLSGRDAALRSAVDRLSAADLAPFDAATARGNGFVTQCLPWAPTPDAPLHRGGDLPDVPALLLAGTHDLSTPLEWARREAAHAPGGRLVVVPGAGHATVRQGGNGLSAMRAFLLR
jgi:pimeloyl-ACP methyl ester carboxylesterase